METAKTLPLSPISPERAVALRKLARCSLLPGTWDKRFIRNLSDSLAGADAAGEILNISDRQGEMIDKLAHKYRRQIAKMR